ncbi:MAG: hypothetical protein R3F60_07110 [bacterium]
MSPERYAPERFLRRMGAVSEPAMRDALWRECLTTIEADAAVTLLEAVFAELDRGGVDARLAWLSLLRVGESLRGGRLGLDIYVAARVRGAVRVQGLFVEPPPARQPGPEVNQRAPLDPEREVTLGERRAWARRPDRTTLERLLADTDPGVVRNLLANPRLTEADVVRLASRRPTTAAVLLEVFQHPRWGRRLQVLEALIFNPYTPIDLACGLVSWLDASQARAVAHSPSVHALVRQEAALRGERGRPAEAVVELD